MPELSGHLIVQAYDRIVLVEVRCERLLDAATIQAIAAELMALLDRYPKPSIVLDLAQVAYMSSAMLGKLVAFHKAAAGLKGRLALAGVRSALRPMLAVTQLDRLIPCYPDAQQAILEFRRRPL